MRLVDIPRVRICRSSLFWLKIKLEKKINEFRVGAMQDGAFPGTSLVVEALLFSSGRIRENISRKTSKKLEERKPQRAKSLVWGAGEIKSYFGYVRLEVIVLLTKHRLKCLGKHVNSCLKYKKVGVLPIRIV